MIVYLALNFTAGAGRLHAGKVEERIENKTSWMKTFKVMTSNLADNIEDKEARKIVGRLVEEIQFSDPVTNDGLSSIESKLSDDIDYLRTAIASEDNEKIIEAAKNAMETLNMRNRLCKQMK